MRTVTIADPDYMDLTELHHRLREGVFYSDHDEDMRLMGVLRRVLADSTLPGMFREVTEQRGIEGR
jgi:hypothetical protein